MASFLTLQLTSKIAEERMQAMIAAGTSAGAFETVGQALVTQIQLGFKFGREPWGTPWEKLKCRKGGSPLRDTGLLRSSIVSKADKSGVTVGTNKIQARVHQFGAIIRPVRAKFLAFRCGTDMHLAKQVTIPARPYLPIRSNKSVDLPDTWSRAVARRLQSYLLQAAKKPAL